MKTRFSTLDIMAILPELKAKICTGWRVNQVYDVDHKTYLFKLNKSIIQMKKDDDPLSVDEVTANKMTFIVESGLRMHTTDYDWPKSHAPSHFATKLRKYIRNKRIENISQVGVDRLVDIQFGANQAANHLLIELYDRGNLILTDDSYGILAILRWRKPTDSNKQQSSKLDHNDSENFKIGQKYPLHLMKNQSDLEPLDEDRIVSMLNSAKIQSLNEQNHKKRNRIRQDVEDGMLEINLKDLFNPHVIYGSSLLEDRLMVHIYGDNKKVKRCSIKIPFDPLSGKLDQERVIHYAKLIKAAFDDANAILEKVRQSQISPGYLIQKKQDSEMTEKLTKATTQKKPNPRNKDKDDPQSVITNVDFFPIQSCAQRKVEQESSHELIIQEYDSFDKAVDVYYSNLESQKIDNQALVAEREAMKKLDNLKIAQERRLDDLARVQKEDEEKARLIELNCDKVENALLILRSMIANQVSWTDIWDTIREAQAMNDPIASLITQVKFDRNEFTMRLCDPYDDNNADTSNNVPMSQESELNGKMKNKKSKGKKQTGDQSQNDTKYRCVDIDISLSAYANARRFFDRRRNAVNKEKKTLEVSKKAFKNVERQTKKKLKEVVVKTNITKARKRYWFENFFWFISSDGYLVVAGRDSEQNELLVKRYMKSNDIYVHADLHGASSVIIKNESNEPVPPKTLVEAGSMSVCYSSAWESKIATTSWWVYPKQVSKTAPAGEYLTQGAFVIRGKKNFLPLSNLVLGFGFLFRLEDESIERRKQERLARAKMQEESETKVVENLSEGDSDQELDEDDEPDEDSQSSDDATVKSTTNEVNQQKDIHLENDDQLVENDANNPNDEADDDDDDDDEALDKLTEYRLVDTLTDSPTADDILLYSIPMCGPYSAFQNFKYKVKVIPGSNKRGKAAKSCLTMFMHDKRATQREKDLLRALKDQDHARNIPNKVKVSAANMNKVLVKRRPKKSEVRLPMM